jgi:hypothetical protein
MRLLLLWAATLITLPLAAAEHAFNFGEFPIDQTPPGFRSTVSGVGKAGDWKVIWDDDVPPALAPISPKAPSVARRAVLAQLSRDPANFHFPMFVFDGEAFGDFTLTTHFKTVGGSMAQLAGVVFRYQNEKNYYALFASSLENRFRFFKVVDGILGTQIGPEVPIAKGQWHEMTLKCEGNHIHCLFEGKELIPMITDSTFTVGRVGFWTKSDSVSYFVDTKITYTPREILAVSVLREALKAYPRVLGLKIFAIRSADAGPVVVASKDESEVGQAGGKDERDVISRGTSYFGKGRDSVSVTLPLKDRNGDPMAAVRVTLKSFTGETEDSAVVRAMPIIRKMQDRVQSLSDLLQ